MTKEKLAKLGINIEAEEIADEEAFALIEKHHNDLVSEKAKLKKRTDELSSEIADRKKADLEKLSEDEKTKLHYEEIEKTNKELSRKIALNEKINDLMSIGYEKDLAKKYAEAELDGKSTIEYQKQFMEAKLEAQKQDLLKQTKEPTMTDPNGSVKTKEDFDKLGYEGQVKLYNEHPEIYKQFATESK